MGKVIKFPKKDGVDLLLDKCYEYADSFSPDSEEFTRIANNVETLKKAKNNGKKIDLNTVLAVGGNLAGLWMIMNFEQAHIITTKAFSHVGRFIRH